MPDFDTQPVKVAEGFAFCEGPAFGPDGNLYVVNLRGGFISRVRLNGNVERFAETPGPNGGQFDADGRYICCEVRRRAIVAVSPGGDVLLLTDNAGGRPLNGPNDIAIDADGGMYFTDPEGSDLDHPIGAVYYIRPDLTTVKVDDRLAYPNGINITVDRRHVLVAETLTKQIRRYERRPDGTLGRGEVFCQLEGGVGPDGMAFDMDGRLYVAHFGMGCIQVIDPSGAVIAQLRTPGNDPTNCCFGPPGSHVAGSLFVTETAGNAVWRYDLGVPGMPLHHLAVVSE